MPRGKKKQLSDDERRFNSRRRARVQNWKNSKVCVPLVLPDEYDSWHDFHDKAYLGATECDDCGFVFGDPGPTGECGGRRLEHVGRNTGEWRGVVCNGCNIARRWSVDGDPKLTEEQKRE
ncbi:hypothetical protein K0U83_20845, partial [bacterium]|nr:hypothetical protein [bacterium]